MKHFIKEINIKQVRHIENLNIKICDDKKKHLILTGKNGSGKTSVLEALMRFLKGIENNEIIRYNSYENQINSLRDEFEKNKDICAEYDTLKDIRSLEQRKDYYTKDLIARLSEVGTIYNDYCNGKFILAYFNAKRNPDIKIPDEVRKIGIPSYISINEDISSMFLNYLVYLKTQQAFARNEEDNETVQEIQVWFDNFEDALKDLFEDYSIKLKFDYRNLNFRLYQDNRKDYGFESLSDGYSAVLDILINLILRMEKTKSNSYDVEGIAIIDEVETHLHIELQKKIMPFLTSFFPNVQFIISTHSPFVLNSLENAVVYDLEKNLRMENLSGYAYDGIVEGYFEVDKYSKLVKENLFKYEELVNKENKSEEELILEEKLRSYLKAVPKELAPELIYKFNNIELIRKLKRKKNSEVKDD